MKVKNWLNILSKYFAVSAAPGLLRKEECYSGFTDQLTTG
jgi:hypothetical protein